MGLLTRLLEPKATVHAHCDLPCGVYDPAQARIEAESVKAIIQKYHDSSDPAFQTRALLIKEQRSELVKHHLWVLWTDYFKPPHFEKYPQLNQLFNEATKLAGGGPAAPRAAPTWPRPMSCWPRSTRSARSSGRPSRADLPLEHVAMSPRPRRHPACAASGLPGSTGILESAGQSRASWLVKRELPGQHPGRRVSGARRGR